MSQPVLQALEEAAATLERVREALRTPRPGCICSCAAHADAYNAILDASDATQMAARSIGEVEAERKAERVADRVAAVRGVPAHEVTPLVGWELEDGGIDPLGWC